MDAEEVEIGEVSSDWRGKVILVYFLQDKVEIFGCRWKFGIDKVDKYIN